jgi:uncharacterized protein (DUF305 family)
MTTSKRLYVLPAVVAAAAVAALSPAGAVASGPAPEAPEAAFEQAFLTNTIDHHFMAVEMGELCVAKGTHPKLPDVCQDIVEDQSAEIEEMRGYLRDWYGYDKEPMMPDDPLDGDMSDMEELEQAAVGEAFDVLVSEMFIEHHLLQIARSKRCLRKAYHDELKDLCRRQIKTQAREIRIFDKVIHAYRDDGGHDRSNGHDGRHHEPDGHRSGRRARLPH